MMSECPNHREPGVCPTCANEILYILDRIRKNHPNSVKVHKTPLALALDLVGKLPWPAPDMPLPASFQNIFTSTPLKGSTSSPLRRSSDGIFSSFPPSSSSLPNSSSVPLSSSPTPSSSSSSGSSSSGSSSSSSNSGLPARKLPSGVEPSEADKQRAARILEFVQSMTGPQAHVNQDLILCMFRHHPRSQNDEAIMEALTSDVNPSEWYAKDDLLFAGLEELAPTPPRFDCPICYENCTMEEMYTMDCISSHRACYNCMKYAVESALRQERSPICPSPGCGHVLARTEIHQITNNKALVDQFDRMQLRSALSGIAGTVACPTVGCENCMIVDNMTQKFHCVCSACGASFCSLCRGPYHYGSTTCQEAKDKEIQWMHWQSQFRLQRASLNKEAEAKLKSRQEEVASRLQQLQADEEWKNANCRMCPQCNRLIQRMEGCSSMKCGADYHGGNQQNGCGASFNWDSAPHYQKTDASHLEAMDLRAEVAKAVGLGDPIDHGEFLCDNCNQKIIGLRFSCLHCPCFNLCEKCEADGASSEHLPRHIFDILGLPPPKEEASSSAPSSSSGKGGFSLMGIFRRKQ